MSSGSDDNRTASCFDDGPERLLHVRCHLDLILTPLPVEPKHRNSPFVLYFGVQFAEAVLIGNHLASSAEPYECAIRAAALLLETNPVALVLLAHIIKLAHAGHIASAAEFNVISA